MNGGTKAKEDARLKKTHHGRIPRGKGKKLDTKEEEFVHVSSEKETSEKANKKEYIKLKKKIIRLKDNFNQFKRTVKDDLSEIKWNLK